MKNVFDEIMKEGRKKEALEIAKRMLKNDVEKDLISDVTGISVEELEKLKNEKTR